MKSAATEQWIVVPRWEDFQHRDAARAHVPTWVKTFTRLLSDDAYLSLTGHQRGVLHGIWLEYARSLRELPGTTLSLSRRLSLKVTEKDLRALNDAGFIELHASNPASTSASNHAGIEQRREEELNPKAVTELHYPEPEPPLDDEPTAATNGRPQDHTHTHTRTTIAASLAQAKGAAA